MNGLKEFQLTAFCPDPGLMPLVFTEGGSTTIEPNLALFAESFEIPG